MSAGTRSNSFLLFSFLLFGAAVGGVKVINSNVSCRETALKFNPDCENTFTLDDKNFASCQDGTTECQPPCKKMEAGRMTLHERVDVTLQVVCVKGNLLDEEQIRYHHLPCSGTTAAQESVRWRLLLLLLLTAAAA